MEERLSDQFRDNPSGITGVLAGASVGIAGAGGIGSNLAAFLVRAGVGRLVIADFDRVELRNLNRQFFFHDQIGCPKVNALKASLLRINPLVDLEAHHSRLDDGTASNTFHGCNVLAEAVDTEETKVMLLECWMRDLPGIPIVACSGIAGHGGTDHLKVDRRRGLTIVGDQFSDLAGGTLAPRVAAVAAMMANEIVELLLEGYGQHHQN